MAGTATHFAVNPQTGERIALIDGQWVPAVQAGSSSGAPKLTEGQAKDGFNAKRIVAAGQALADLENQGFDASLGAINPGHMLGRQREYDQAAKEWADSLLRMTTGAAMTKDEIAHAEATYFPQLGDSLEVRRQKAAARARVQQDALTRAGPGVMGPPTATGGLQGGVPRPVGPPQGAPRKPVPGGFRIISVE